MSEASEQMAFIEKGTRIGRLMAIEKIRVDRRYYWKCICDCGNYTNTREDGLKNGHTKSCGCYKADIQRERCKIKNTTHGLGNTRLYSIWHGMINRCENKNHRAFTKYGKRGIKVFGEWKSSFISFYEWALSNGYSDHLTLDRINNDGDYMPDNCRWATKKEQSNNTSSTRRIAYQGNMVTVSELSELTGIKRSTLYSRLFKQNWPIEKATTYRR